MIDSTLELMINRVLSRYAELAGSRLAVDPGTAYAMLDGIFERALLQHVIGNPDAGSTLRRQALTLGPGLLQASAP